jgi:hypothetical protein
MKPGHRKTMFLPINRNQSFGLKEMVGTAEMVVPEKPS